MRIPIQYILEAALRLKEKSPSDRFQQVDIYDLEGDVYRLKFSADHRFSKRDIVEKEYTLGDGMRKRVDILELKSTPWTLDSIELISSNPNKIGSHDKE